MKLASVPACPECESFDLETRTKMREVFSEDEVSLMIMMTAGQCHARTATLHTMHDDDIKKLLVQRDLDFAAQMLGKLLIALEPDKKLSLVRLLRERGIILNVQHQVCPHKPKVAVSP